MADTLVPSTPDPSIVAIVSGLVRELLALASAFGFTWALTVSGSQIMMISTALVAIGTAGWTVAQKIIAARREHEIAIESAAASAQATMMAGQPVVVAVQPPPSKV